MKTVREIGMEFMGRGGKRLRPRLCQAVYAKLGGSRDGGDINILCEAVECFHKASLIHDDIQDADEERYGKPTVWKEHGIPMAIAVGDWLVATGYTMISESGFGFSAKMLEAAARSHLKLSEGQAEELAGSTDRIAIFEKKTAEAFALAAELGALAAGADPEPYRRYALAYGILFQINDDIADRGADPELLKLKEKYEDEAALYRDKCALGVW